MAKQFFSKEAQAQIVAAIQSAEKATSGEIRVHVEPKTDLAPIDRAKIVFDNLGMGKTNLKNAVLLYLSFEDRKFAIIGDSGIHEKVGDDFWQAEKELLKTYFSKNEFANGLALAITHVGEKLKAYFPYQENDVNELSNEISFGGETNE